MRKRPFALVLLLLILPATAFAESTVPEPSALDLHAPSLADQLLAQRGPARIDATASGLGELQVRPVNAFAPDARILLHTRQGVEKLPIPEGVRFRGEVVGEPRSKVMLTILPTGIRGLVLRDGGTWILGQGEAAKASEHVLQVRRIDTETELAEKASSFSCGTEHLERGGAVDFEPGSALDVESALHELRGSSAKVDVYGYTARLALDTDNEYLDLFGGDTTQATNYAADLVAYSSSSYEDEIDTDLVITSLTLWDTTDPWDESSVLCRFYEFGQYWNANHTDVDRTVAHFLSAKGNGGVAWVNALCISSFNVNTTDSGCTLSPTTDAYGGAYGYNGSLDGDFDYDNPSILWDIVVFTHELGHNFGSRHSHCYGGVDGIDEPVDGCSTAECGDSGCYCDSVGLPDGCGGSGQNCGTAMSYCHQRSGGISNMSLSFGTDHPYGISPGRIADRMSTRVASKAASNPGCLDALCPGGSDPTDSDTDGYPDECDDCLGDDATGDSDGDNVCNDLDVCAGSDDGADADNDDVPDGCDLCAGSDDGVDSDNDDVPDGCDVCEGDDATGDSDGDSVCNDLDICAGSDDSIDSDGDDVPDGCDFCEGDDATTDSDSDGVCDDLDICAGSDDGEDADSDDVPDGCDLCTGDDATGDSDSDGVCNDLDICAGSDDGIDTDTDGLPDGCDLCTGPDNVDADSDGVCDSLDVCTGDDATGDSDSDGVCDNLDVCAGSDDGADADTDGLPDGCDPCVGPDNVDADLDGICDSLDTCQGDDATGDSDSDGVCNDIDACEGSDDGADGDGDGLPDGCDLCTGPDNVDADLDGVCDSLDVCQGDDTTGDVDGDLVCADLDCNDDDSGAQTVDGCGVCGGDNTACGIFDDDFESGGLGRWSTP